MLRTIVYNGPPQPATMAAAKGNSDPVGDAPKDGYLEKLVKYVPAEVVAVYVALAAAARDRTGLMWVVFGAGAVATVGYVYFHASQLRKEKQPRYYTYVISLLAFALWATGASDSTRGLLHIDAITSEVALGLGVLLLPLIDFLWGQLDAVVPNMARGVAATLKGSSGQVTEAVTP